MLNLDGSAGGGQLVRTALTLSMLTETPFRMADVRGGRPNPGLRPQHLAAVRLAKRLCQADVEGAAAGSCELAFEPGRSRGGRVEVDVGTAGSVTLLADVALPLAYGLDEPLYATITGGTDVSWSPTVAYLGAVKLRLLRRHGLQAALDVERTGFYPVGGGVVRLALAPSELERIDLTERGELEGVRVYSKASTELAEPEVAERQAAAAVEELQDAGVAESDESENEARAPVVERSVTYVAADCPGSTLSLRVDYAGSVAGFDALGERGKPAEDVAGGVVQAAADFQAGSAAVDEHMADQLLVYLALWGGRVRVPAITDHVKASLDLLSAFGFDVAVERVNAEAARDAAEGAVLVAEGTGHVVRG